MHLFSAFAIVVPFIGSSLVKAQSTECTTDTAIQRKEWTAMQDDERRAYIDAVECLMEAPSMYDSGVVPASTSYFSDFAAAHANISLSVHRSGTFLSWHRQFLHLFEEALHQECGYPADLGLPYWDWPAYTNRPLVTSAIFDGSSTSLGGNGQPIDTRSNYEVLDAEEAVFFDQEFSEGSIIPRGTGGGCVMEGPFSNTTVYLGPFSPPTALTPELPSNWTEPNPNCFSRDLNDWTLRTFNSAQRVESLLATRTIEDFQDELNIIHFGGHISIGGQTADFYVSPIEPAFFLHHGQVDRLWTMWQAENESQRFEYNGTSTFQNPIGDTPEVHNDTEITFVPLGENVQLWEAADPMSGRYCYRYV